MPRVSDRQNALRCVKQKVQLDIALESSSTDSSDGSLDMSLGSFETFDPTNCTTDEDSDSSPGLDSSSDLEQKHGDEPPEFETNPTHLMELYFVMYNTRYLVDRPITTKSKEFATQFFLALPDKLFRQLTRMDKRSFFQLVELISPHPVFHNDSNHEQAPIESQLAVCLDRLGHDGNGACLNHMIPTWGVSNGSLVNFSKRCFLALESVLKEEVEWPTRRERAVVSEEFGKLGFAGCVGLIDGSLLPLAQRPRAHGECYFDRKSNYSINVQVVCDHRRKILFMFTGMPGSCSDLTCVRKSPLFKHLTDVNPNLLFAEGQYLLGDSGYQTLPHMVSAFKRADTSNDKEDFNTCIAKCRVTNEHCIGVLKSRWHSLKQIRVQINWRKDSQWMVRWIALCGKLHNCVMRMKDPWTEEDEAMEIDSLPVNDPGPVGDVGRVSRRGLVNAGTALLERVMAGALEHHRQPGHFLNTA